MGERMLDRKADNDSDVKQFSVFFLSSSFLDSNSIIDGATIATKW